MWLSRKGSSEMAADESFATDYKNVYAHKYQIAIKFVVEVFLLLIIGLTSVTSLCPLTTISGKYHAHKVFPTP